LSKYQQTEKINYINWKALILALFVKAMKTTQRLYMTHTLSQCRKTVMTPLKNIKGTRTIKGYFFYENLRPNQQLDVHAM
jgi:hypothetical protein